MIKQARMCPLGKGVTPKRLWSMNSSMLWASTTNSLVQTEMTMFKSGGTRLKKVGLSHEPLNVVCLLSLIEEQRGKLGIPSVRLSALWTEQLEKWGNSFYFAEWLHLGIRNVSFLSRLTSNHHFAEFCFKKYSLKRLVTKCILGKTPIPFRILTTAIFDL